MEEKNKSYIKWYFSVVIFIVILAIGVVIYLNNTKTIATVADLNKEITVGKLTYYVQNDWKNDESSSENVTYKYYYPTIDTMLMVTIQKGENYGNNITETFLDGFISGLSDTVKSKNIKAINNKMCGIVKFDTYIGDEKYETLSYIIPNNNECYVFMLGQKNKLKNNSMSLIEDIVLKSNVALETKEEKEKRLEQEKIEKAKKEEEKRLQKEQEERSFKLNCKTYTYKEIARNPSNYIGKPVKFTGKVVQVSEGYSDEIAIRLNITKNKYGYYEDTIYCNYTYTINESKILEDDIITIYGICQGDTSYTSIMGTVITLPEVDAKYLTIIE